MSTANGGRPVSPAGGRLQTDTGLNSCDCCEPEIPDCPPAALLTLDGVDASTPCVNRALGLGLACSSPYYCVSGVTTAVDDTYYVPRWRGPTSDGWCEFRGEFDADCTFTRSTPASVFLGIPSGCHDPVDFTTSRIRVFVRVNRGNTREVWVWALSDAWAGVGVATVAIPISFFNGYLWTVTYTNPAPGVTPTLTPTPFDGCSAATCGRLMSGGGFLLERSL